MANRPPPQLQAISAVELQRKDIPPLHFIVSDLLPRGGLHILASPPKYGKSWISLDLCLSIASGSPFLRHRTNKTACLYLALEDSERRLKSRMNKLLDGRPAPQGFYFSTACASMDNGLFPQLEGFLKEHPDTGLIILDTFQKVRGASNGRESAYSTDYKETGALKAFADHFNLSVLIVHHLRKMKDEGDPFAMISGTNGIMGAADTAWVMVKEERNSANTKFCVTGRDVETSETVLTFDKTTCKWANLGNADWFAEQQARQEYEASPFVLTVKKLLSQTPNGWTGTAQQLLDAGRILARCNLATSARGVTTLFKKYDRLLMEYDGIAHEREGNGSGGGKHRLFYVDNEPSQVSEPLEIAGQPLF